MWQTVQFGLRAMRKSPGFTAVAVLTLALGIGANTAMFSVVEALLLRPLPLPASDRLVFLSTSNPRRTGAGVPFSLIAYETIRDAGRSFTGITAFCTEGLTITGTGDPEQVAASLVAPNFFDVAGVHPALGRGFSLAEGDPGGNPVAVISSALWQRRFGGDSAVIGQPLTLASTRYTVIGVMPPEFPFPFAGTDVWITRLMNYSGLQAEQIRNGAGYLTGIARLRPGAGPRQAEAELATLYDGYKRAHPGNPDADPSGRMEAVPLQETLVANIRPTLLLLSGAVAFVLLIASANTASLLLARATGRAKEIAVRAALGAGRLRLLRQLLVESALLAGAGAALGLALAAYGVPVLSRAIGADLPGFRPVGVDAGVLVFAAGISLLTAIVFGLAPAIEISRPDLNRVLRDGGWGTTGGARRNRVRHTVLVAQIAFSIVLLIGAGLLLASFRRLQSVNPGFEPQDAITMRVFLPPAKYPGDSQKTQFARELVERLERVPGARAASVSLGLPLASNVMAPFLAEGRPAVAMGERPLAVWNAVTPNYFRTLGIPILRGRPFQENEDAGAPAKVIISDSLARRFWPGADPVGRHLIYARRQIVAEVVGVSGDVKTQALEAEPGMVFYTPYAQFPWPNVSITVRTASDPRRFLNAARAQVSALDRDLPVVNPRTLEESIAGTLSQRRETMYLVTGFAVLALALAVIGIYGVMAYSVAQRTTEIGIRQAIGAQRGDILRMVFRDGLRLGFAGVAAGALAAAMLTRLISTMLYRVSATDPLVFGGVAVVFLAATLAACYVPAWRAMRVDPVTALRAR
jgi:putative ABC transport system permease protein